MASALFYILFLGALSNWDALNLNTKMMMECNDALHEGWYVKTATRNYY
jgi:hypothetical protein